MNERTFLRRVAHHLTSLTTQDGLEISKLTVFGRRILELSKANRSSLLSAELLRLFSKELRQRVNSFQLQVGNSTGDRITALQHKTLSGLLRQYSELAEGYEQMSHRKVVREVYRLERAMRAAIFQSFPRAA